VPLDGQSDAGRGLGYYVVPVLVLRLLLYSTAIQISAIRDGVSHARLLITSCKSACLVSASFLIGTAILLPPLGPKYKGVTFFRMSASTRAQTDL
jgi:hypothetical protein